MLTWNGSEFHCVVAKGGTAYTPGNAISLNNDEIAVVSPICSGTDKLSWDGSSFVCSPDQNTDTLQALSCLNNQIAKYNGSNWVCANDDGGSGSTTFVGLTDTPASYSANQLVRVNALGTALEYYSDTTYYDNTDNQRIDTFTLAADVLTLEMQNDGQPAQTVNLAGYLDNTDSQAISRTGNTISITGNTSTVDLTPYVNTDNQTLTLNANILSISGGNNVSLAGYLDNTDTQSLSIVDHTVSLTNGGSVLVPDNDTTYTASGTLLNLTGTNFSLNEGNLTDGRICTYVLGTGLVCNTNSTNWDTAYSWGNHSTQGYLTDAPSNGNTYGRRNGAWTTITAGGTPAGASGAIQFNSGGSFGADDANFFWDDTSNRLGIGTATPNAKLSIFGIDNNIRC